MAKSKLKAKRKKLGKLKANAKHKAKSKSAAKKRFKVLGSGKVKINHAGKKHNTGHKRRAVKNGLRKGFIMDDANIPNAQRCLPNSGIK